MNSIDLKSEKENAKFSYQNLQKITTLFRFIEMFVFLILISKISSQFPFTIKISADQLSGTVFSPKFVFVIGNLIILILLFKSRDPEPKLDVYEDCVQKIEKNAVNNIIPIEKRKIYRTQSENLVIVECKVNQTHRKLRRSVTDRKISKKLVRGDVKVAVEEKSFAAEDELSGEEFRRTVEEFIAKQQRSLRDESFSPVECIGA